MKNPRNILIPILGITGLVELVAALSYRHTACYGGRLARAEWQYGWPFGYGVDQHDVFGEFLWNLASFDLTMCVVDMGIGLALGVGAGLIIMGCTHGWTFWSKNPEQQTPPSAMSFVGASVAGLTTVILILLLPQEQGPPKMLKFQLQTIAEGLSIFKEEQRCYPHPGEDLSVLVTHGVLRRLPTDPWDRPYLYTIDARGPVVSTLGADGKPGGQGDDADWDQYSINAPSAECAP
jgi:general secretion pathway protein G